VSRSTMTTGQPSGSALRKLWQTPLRQPDVLVDVGAHHRLIAGREQFLDGRLLGDGRSLRPLVSNFLLGSRSTELTCAQPPQAR
jgi:hypothetical protein